MSESHSALLARALWVSALVLGAAGLLLQVLGKGFHVGDALGAPLGLIILLGFATLGLLIVGRQRGNIIGWLFLGSAAFWGLSSLASGYAYFAFANGRTSSLLAKIADWSGQWNWMPLVFLLPPLLALLFPDGHPLSARWRFAVWGVVVCSTLIVVSTAI